MAQQNISNRVKQERNRVSHLAETKSHTPLYFCCFCLSWTLVQDGILQPDFALRNLSEDPADRQTGEQTVPTVLQYCMQYYLFTSWSDGSMMGHNQETSASRRSCRATELRAAFNCSCWGRSNCCTHIHRHSVRLVPVLYNCDAKTLNRRKTDHHGHFSRKQ